MWLRLSSVRVVFTANARSSSSHTPSSRPLNDRSNDWSLHAGSAARRGSVCKLAQQGRERAHAPNMAINALPPAVRSSFHARTTFATLDSTNAWASCCPALCAWKNRSLDPRHVHPHPQLARRSLPRVDGIGRQVKDSQRRREGQRVQQPRDEWVPDGVSPQHQRT